MSLIDPQSVPHLAERYPHRPGRLRHALTTEPLLSPAALADAASALPLQHVHRAAHRTGGRADRRTGAERGDPATAIATGGADREWITLRSIEQLPRYRALLIRLIGELAPVIGPATGRVCDVRGCVVIAGPGTHIPFHFDAEYSILFQIAGDKHFAAYPPGPPYLDLARLEAYHRAGENRLEWKPAYAAGGEQHLLSPGDALFVPHAAPHWVHAGEGRSISLSVTWQCTRTRAVADALTLNPLLRRVGLPAFDPAASPATPWLRAAASRMGQRIGLI
jgi:hypothetical protein